MYRQYSISFPRCQKIVDTHTENEEQNEQSGVRRPFHVSNLSKKIMKNRTDYLENSALLQWLTHKAKLRSVETMKKDKPIVVTLLTIVIGPSGVQLREQSGK